MCRKIKGNKIEKIREKNTPHAQCTYKGTRLSVTMCNFIIALQKQHMLCTYIEKCKIQQKILKEKEKQE